jgi:hypothetical protein
MPMLFSGEARRKVPVHILPSGAPNMTTQLDHNDRIDELRQWFTNPEPQLRPSATTIDWFLVCIKNNRHIVNIVTHTNNKKVEHKILKSNGVTVVRVYHRVLIGNFEILTEKYLQHHWHCGCFNTTIGERFVDKSLLSFV